MMFVRSHTMCVMTGIPLTSYSDFCFNLVTILQLHSNYISKVAKRMCSYIIHMSAIVIISEYGLDVFERFKRHSDEWNTLYSKLNM